MTQLLVAFVEGRERGARELQLTARLERDRRAATRQADRPPLLLLGLPPEPVRELPEHDLDAPAPREAGGTGALALDDDLLVLRANAPPLARLAGSMKLLDQLLHARDGDGLVAGAKVRHAARRPYPPGPAVARSGRGLRLLPGGGPEPAGSRGASLVSGESG